MKWKGLPPKENEWLIESKLKHATDVMQDYLNELSNKGRPFASSRVGGPDSVSAQGDNAVSQDKTGSQGAEGGQGSPAVPRLFRSAAEAGLRSSSSVVQLAAVHVCQQWLAVATAGLSAFVRVCDCGMCIHILVVR